MKMPSSPSLPQIIALVINAVVVAVSYICFRYTPFGPNPLLFTISAYVLIISIVVFCFGILWVLFNNWRDGQKVLAILGFLILMISLWMFAGWWIQPNSDYLGNAGIGVIGAVIGGFICKVFIPD